MAGCRPLGALGLVIGLGLVTWSQPARADAESYDVVSLGECLTAHATELDYLLGIELGAPGWLRQPDAAWRVTVSCDATRIEVRVTGAGTEQIKTIELEQLDARIVARVVALAIADLLERSRQRAPEAPPGPVAPVVLRPPPPPARTPQPSVWIELALRTFLSSPGIGVGAGLRSLVPVSERFELALGLVAERAVAEQAVGRIRAESGSFDAGVGFRWLTPGIVLHTGAGVRAGYVRLNGLPNPESMLRGSAVAGVWGGPQLNLLLALRITQELQLGARAEFGAMLLRVEARAPDPAWDSAWLVGSVGLGWQFH
jgi:hypothetical protein